MKPRLVALLAIALPFAVLSTIATIQHGYLAIFEVGIRDTASAQVFADLCVSLFLVSSWIRADARSRGVAWVPWLIGTVFVGSFAPLGYLLLREVSKKR